MSSAPRPIIPNTGSVIDAKDVLGRDETCDEAFALFAQGNNLLLPDPRRMGKSCLLSRLAFRAPAGFTVVQIDFQGVGSTDQFLHKLIGGLLKHASFGHRFRTLAGSLLAVARPTLGAEDNLINPVLATLGPSVILQRVLDSIDGKLEGNELLILACDEVPMAIENICAAEGAGAAKVLLSTLRELRRRADSQVRWLITGSVGFHHVVKKAGTTIGVINDLGPLKLGPLDGPNAYFLASCLMMGIRRQGDDAATRLLVQLSDGIPFLLHHLAHQVRSGTGPATEAEVQAAFKTFIEDREQSAAMTHLVTRLDGYYGELAAPARTILDHLARSAAGASFTQLGAQGLSGEELGPALDFLVDDHYLTESSGVFNWRYDVLKTIWITRRRLT